MPKFFYIAKSREGETKSGIQEAQNINELTRSLRQEGYFLISTSLEKEKKKKIFEISLSFLNSVSLKEKMFFTRNLMVMIGAGLALPRALKILAEQSKNKKFKKILTNISEEITKGKSFSQTLSIYPDIFSEIFQNMIKIGEEAGTLEEVLNISAQQMEKENELKSKIIGALIYPSVVIFAMILIGILMLVFVVPNLAATFKELEIELPLSTRIVIFLGTFLAEKWYLGILILIIFLFLFKIFLNTKIGKKIISGIFLKTPGISDLIKKTNSAYICRTLASLTSAGVSIIKSLEIISRSLGNVFFREALAKAGEDVRKGIKLHQALKSFSSLFPSLVLQMMEIGEETGETSTILNKLANSYEDDVANITKNLSSIIEPVIMLLIGAIVGFFAISMIQPMYTMLQGIK